MPVPVASFRFSRFFVQVKVFTLPSVPRSDMHVLSAVSQSPYASFEDPSLTSALPNGYHAQGGSDTFDA